ncbi:MAG: hypothetical protein JWN27_2945 [Candidatus Eremiobacteraeota bacterium]|nr:hypothetical protein [Candidatus Eremiobacteraeota bacterium]
MTVTNTALARRDDDAGAIATIAEGETFSLQARNYDEAWQFAETIAKSDLAPKDYRGKPANVLVAVQMGQEVGLKPMQALQAIAIINGRPSLYGDGLLGVVRDSPLCEWIKEYRIGTPGTDGDGWTCEAKRVGDPNIISNTFTVADAKAAGLWNKEGPWKQYGATRMTKMRARSWTCRDGFADVLKGLRSAEEMLDVPDETREAITNAPTRREAVKIALAARAPRRVTTTVDAVQPASGQASADPDFAKVPAQELRDWVDQLAIDNGVSPADLAQIVREHGGFKRSVMADIVADVRGRKPAAPASEPVGELVEDDPEPVDDLDEHDAELPLS